MAVKGSARAQAGVVVVPLRSRRRKADISSDDLKGLIREAVNLGARRGPVSYQCQSREDARFVGDRECEDAEWAGVGEQYDGLVGNLASKNDRIDEFID